MIARKGRRGAKLELDTKFESLVTCLFVDSLLLLAEREVTLQKVNEFYVCKRQYRVVEGKCH